MSKKKLNVVLDIGKTNVKLVFLNEKGQFFKEIKTKQTLKFYKNRSLLKVSILPQDIAEGVYFFASSKSKKSTGNILNVDGGNITSFTR